MIVLKEDRTREAILDACSVRQTQSEALLKIEPWRFDSLGKLMRDCRYDVKVEVPIFLWEALDSALDLAKCRWRGRTKRSLSSAHKRLKKIMNEDAVTRLARIGTQS